MNAIGLKSMVVGAACASMMIAGSSAAAAQTVGKSAKVAAAGCDTKQIRNSAGCRNATRASAPVAADASYQSSRARPVGSIIIPIVGAAAAVGLAIALASSGNGRGPIPVVSP